MKTLLIWTDGSCLGNPGPGGWAFLIRRHDATTIEKNGHEPATTNNRMEMLAAIKALQLLQTEAPHAIALYSDSKLLVHTMRSSGWTRRANLDLWAELDRLKGRHQIEWRWVRGHNGDPDNARVDKLARHAARHGGTTNGD